MLVLSLQLQLACDRAQQELAYKIYVRRLRQCPHELDGSCLWRHVSQEDTARAFNGKRRFVRFAIFCRSFGDGGRNHHTVTNAFFYKPR